MARRRVSKGTPARADSKLNQALVAGKSIKGLVGFVNITDGDSDAVYAKVSCVGFTGEDDDGCSCRESVKIRAKVVGTGSIITFGPCDWLDTLKEVEADTDLNRRKAKAHREYREILNHHYLARRRLALEAYILDHLENEDKRAIKQDLEEHKLTLASLDEQRARDYAKKATLIANSIAPEDADRYYD